MFMNATSPLSNRAAQRSIHQLFLNALHFCGGAAILVVKAVEMKEGMRDVQTDLPLDRISKPSRLFARRLRTYENLTVLKGDHIRGTRLMKEAAMQLRDAPV